MDLGNLKTVVIVMACIIFRGPFVIWYVVSFLTFVSFDQLWTVNVKFPLKVRRYKLYFLHTMCGNVLFFTFKFLASFFFIHHVFSGGGGAGGEGKCVFFWERFPFGVNSQTETHFIAFQKPMAGRTLLWNERLRFSLNVRLNFCSYSVAEKPNGM